MKENGRQNRVADSDQDDGVRFRRGTQDDVEQVPVHLSTSAMRESHRRLPRSRQRRQRILCQRLHRGNARMYDVLQAQYALRRAAMGTEF